MNGATTSEARLFHLGDLLSVTTGVLVSPRYMDGVCDILGYLLTTQFDLDRLTEAMDLCRPFLLTEFPSLLEVRPVDVSFENWRGWLDEQVGVFGEWQEVQRPRPGQIALPS